MGEEFVGDGHVYTRGCVPGLSPWDYCNIVHRLCEGKSLSCVQFFETPWTVAYQAPPSMGFSRQEYWHGLPFPSPGDLPDSGIEPSAPTFRANALPSEPLGKPLAMFQYKIKT